LDIPSELQQARPPYPKLWGVLLLNLCRDRSLIGWEKGSFVAQPSELVPDAFGDRVKVGWTKGLINLLGSHECSSYAPAEL
jgi:hypothetical protein